MTISWKNVSQKFSYASWLAAIVLVALGSIKSDINKRKRLKESKEELSSREPTQHMSLSIFSVSELSNEDKSGK